ncbi:MAG: hypothetical protein KBI01_06795 [Oscillospiraceae bacterium]|nr:hypothetical protein [Oscillospiraceae bacterium]
MKDRAKLIDTAKNLVIVVLLLSAIFLLLKAVVINPKSTFESIGGFFGRNSAAGTVSPQSNESTENAASPVFLLITTEDGSHYAVKYDIQVKNKIISQFSGYLGEALGSSSSLHKITVEQWQEVLSGTGVFFDYLYPQPLSAIASWLGTSVTNEAANKTARRLFLGNDNGNLILYFMSESDGNIYSCKTARSFSSLSPKIAEYPLGTASFAFELDPEYANLDPYFIFSRESKTLQAITASTPVRDSTFDSYAMLSYFGMNSHVVSEHTEADGSEVFVDGDKTLRIEASGKASFSVSGSTGVQLIENSEASSISDYISAFCKIAKNSVGLNSGDAVVGLVNINDKDFPSSCTISFGYFADGIPFTLPGGKYAAYFEVSNGTLVKAELYFRKYSFSGGSTIALPEKQVTAIVEAKGGEPVLTYEDKTDSVVCSWIIK